MFATIIMGLLLLVALAGAIVFLRARKKPVVSKDKWSGKEIEEPNPVTLPAFVTAAAALVIFAIIAIFACTVIVGTRQTGIVTKWNRPTGETMQNGLHFKLPWTDVHEMDTAIQNDVYNGDKRIAIRLCNNSTAYADANVRWQINQNEADELFVQYKTFDGVRSNLVERNLRTALNEAFTACFDPLSSDAEKNNLPATVDKAKKTLQDKAGDQVEILDISVPIIDYDDNTEQRINAINGARADYTRAEQEAKTAAQKRAAAEELAKQPVPDLKIAIAACVNKMAETGQSLNCYPIGGGVLPTIEVPHP